MMLFPLSLIVCFKIVNEYQKLIIFRLGYLTRSSPKGPGMCWFIPCVDQIFLIDLRVISFDVPTQEALTKDAVSVTVDAVIYTRVFEPLLSVMVVEDQFMATHFLAMTMLRNAIGSRSLNQLLVERQQLQNTLLKNLDMATDPWGIKIERVEIKEVRIPFQMQRAMAAEAQAIQEARAKVISAEGELSSAKSLREAATIITKSPEALQLKYLHTLNAISTEKNNLIVCPIPQGIFQKFH